MNNQDWRLYKRLLKRALASPLFFGLGIFGFVLYASSGAALADIMRQLVDAIELQNPDDRLRLPLMMVVIFAVRGVGTFLGTYFLEVVARNLVHVFRLDLFKKYLTIPVALLDQSGQGNLVSRITFNVEQVTQAATTAVTVMVREGLFVIGLMAYMLWIDWQLTLVFFAVAPLIGLVVSAAGKAFRRQSKRIQDSMGDLTQKVGEVVEGSRVLRVFGAQDMATEKFGEVSEHNRKQNLKLAGTKAISVPLIQLLVAMSLSFLVWLALSPGFLGEASTGTFVAFITAASMMAKPLRQLSEISAVLQRGLAAAGDLFEVLDQAEEQDLGHSIPGTFQSLDFDAVSFAYAGCDTPAIRDLSFSLRPGKITALAGPSGAGKTTVAALVSRFYEPSAGRILLNDHNAGDFRLDAFRSQLAWVGQQVVVFDGTLRENLTLGLERTDQQLWEALQQAQAAEFAEKLDGGLDAKLGSDGTQLSGGQRQRLAIARALLVDAPVLILDEATSALDNLSERAFQEALDVLSQHRAVLVIAHRLSTIRGADEILVMQDGAVAERGTHQTLIDAQGLYARLHAQGDA